MSIKHRNRASKISLLFTILGTLVWSLGMSAYPVPHSDDQLPPTQSPQTEEVTLTETSTPIELATSTLTPNPTEPEPTSKVTQTSESEIAVTKSHLLPAIFASGAYAQNQLVVRFKISTSRSRIDECFHEIDAQVQTEIEELNTFVLVDESGELANTFYQVLDCAGALYVEPNFLLQTADTIPNDTNWNIQYGLVNIHAPQGWDLSTGSTGVTIAVVDTGVDQSHPDLAGKLVTGYDFVNNDPNPQDDNGHGTHVAGIAAASSNNGFGIAGVSWGTRIMPVKVLSASGGGTYADTAAGIVWATNHGAQVINLSLGGLGESAILEDAINYAHNKGVVMVAAAGNSGSSFVLYPARYPNVIAVAKTNSANAWDGSNYGSEIDLSAPGAMIYSTVIGGYDYNSGSSMSAGFVSGLAAILIGIPGNTSPGAIEYQMESTALDIEFPGWDDYTGAGLIQMDTAIQLALQSASPTEDSESSNPSPSIGSSAIQIVATNTPLATWTASPTPPDQGTNATFTSTPTSSISETAITTKTSVDDGSEVEAQTEAKTNGYFLPCAAIFFILLGAVVLWITKKRQREL